MHHRYTPPDVEFFIYRQAEPIAEDDGTSHDNGYFDPWSLVDEPALAAPGEEENNA